MRLRDEYRAFDAEARYAQSLSNAPDVNRANDSPCISGDILRGARRPTACAAFGTCCTPDHPLGATMVSSEGACAAYFRYAQPARTSA
jgi:hydrogenase expression/formation protein HypD